MPGVFHGGRGLPDQTPGIDQVGGVCQPGGVGFGEAVGGEGELQGRGLPDQILERQVEDGLPVPARRDQGADPRLR